MIWRACTKCERLHDRRNQRWCRECNKAYRKAWRAKQETSKSRLAVLTARVEALVLVVDGLQEQISQLRATVAAIGGRLHRAEDHTRVYGRRD